MVSNAIFTSNTRPPTHLMTWPHHKSPSQDGGWYYQQSSNIMFFPWLHSISLFPAVKWVLWGVSVRLSIALKFDFSQLLVSSYIGFTKYTGAASILVCTCVCVYMRVHVHGYVCMRMCVWTCVCMGVCVYVATFQQSTLCYFDFKYCKTGNFRL